METFMILFFIDVPDLCGFFFFDFNTPGFLQSNVYAVIFSSEKTETRLFIKIYIIDFL